MASSVEQIKDKLDIVDVISSYLKLERAGANYKARCPFHNEKTASFFISPARQTYHCFGCNRGGDMFSFVQDMEGIDFRGALKTLADRAGVDIVPVRGETKDERDMLYRALELATTHFEKNLRSSKETVAYLKGRGVAGETARAFRIGYAAGKWRDLRDALSKKGCTDQVLEKAGLVIRSEKGYYDRFRERVMFPITDGSGRIIGFSGRILPGAKDEATTGKYVNTPETEVYHKSKALYGIDKAKTAIRTEGVCVIVEGQMDLVMSHQAGVLNTVATSGTALTEEHLVLISRLADSIVFAFDADAAGARAAERGIDLALAAGLEVRVAALPKGEDPADVIAKDPEAWKKALAYTSHIVDFLLEALPKENERAFRKEVTSIVLPYVARMPSSIERAQFVGKIARALNVSEEPIWEELRSIRVPVAQKKEEEKGSVTPVSRTAKIAEKIVGLILWQKGAEKPVIDVADAEKQFRMITGKEAADALMSGGEKNDWIFEAEVYYEGMEQSDASGAHPLEGELHDLLYEFEKETLREAFARAMDTLREAEQKGDEKETKRILQTCQEISKKLSEITKHS